jgi:hypothetical protein
MIDTWIRHATVRYVMQPQRNLASSGHAADRLVFGSPVTVSCHINMACHLGTWRSLHPTPRRLTATVLT